MQRGDRIQIAPDRLAYGGRAVGRVDGLVVFITGAVPGDLVLARVDRVRRSYAEADTDTVVTPSPHRIPPRCPHFGPCGGCTWQHITYPAQLTAKEALVRESLVHLGGMGDVRVDPIVAAEDPWYYRNKMEFSFHPDGTLGLHRRSEWNRIVPVETCLLQSSGSSAVVNAVRTFVRQYGPVVYDPKTRAGMLRSLVIRESRSSGDRLVGIVTGEGAFPRQDEFVRTVRAATTDVTGVVRGIVGGPSVASPFARTETLYGRDYVEEELAGLRFRIGIETFFQTNTVQAAKMVEYVVGWVQPASGRLVVDLYCGIGTFSLPLARSGARVVGIELAPSSVEAARKNADLNGVRDVVFVAGDARIVLPEMVARHGVPDVIVLDPPRAGAGGKVMRKIGRIGARRVIYISCNPTTLAPDLKELLPFGYELTAVQPFDLFPQTYHVETVAVLDRCMEV